MADKWRYYLKKIFWALYYIFTWLLMYKGFSLYWNQFFPPK